MSARARSHDHVAVLCHAVGYLRVSTNEQRDSGLGLAAQRAAVEAAAHRLGLPLAAVYSDGGVSGSTDLAHRPALLEAVAMLRRGDTLLIAKRDRLGRDVIHVAMIERLIARKGARVVSAAGEGTDSDGPTAQLMRRIIDAFAEYERLLIGARTKAALAQKKAKGERCGEIPFGLRVAADGRMLETDPDEARTLARLRELRASGMSLHAVADRLNAEGLRTRRGSEWRPQYVGNLSRGLGRTRRRVERG